MSITEADVAELHQALASCRAPYRIVRPLSKGSFGSVCHAEGPSGPVAIKFMRLGEKEDTTDVLREIMHHQKLLHAHVVRFKEAFAAPPFLCICMEFVPGGDLLDYINSKRGGLGEDEARYIFQQLVIAVDYCHRSGVMNRDIKPENTLLVRLPDKPPLVKLCDFGYAKSLEDSAPATRAGTMNYTAPEVMLNIRPHHYDGMKADIFSLGIVLFVMLFCSFPFCPPQDRFGSELAQLQRMLRRMKAGDFTFPAWKPVSEECQSLVEHMLDPDHAKRFSIEDVKRHPWFLRNLLPGALQYNDLALSKPRVLPQSEQEVKAAIDKVRLATQSSGSSSQVYSSFQLESDEEGEL